MLNKSLVGLFCAMFLYSCGAGRTLTDFKTWPEEPIHAAPPAYPPENYPSSFNLMRANVIQYRVAGTNESLWELLRENMNVIFAPGEIEGFLLEETPQGCIKWKFVIYALGEDKTRASSIMINDKIFQRRAGFGPGVVSGPLGYGEAEVHFFFLYADELLREYNALTYSPNRFYRIIGSKDYIYRDFYGKEGVWSSRKHCLESREWLIRPDVLHKFHSTK